MGFSREELRAMAWGYAFSIPLCAIAIGFDQIWLGLLAGYAGFGITLWRLNR